MFSVSSSCWFNTGYMCTSGYGGFVVQTAENCGVSAVAVHDGRRYSCRGAEAVSHGLAVQQTIEILLLILNTVIDVPVAQVVQVASYLAVTCSEFACGVQDCGRFWKITSGWIPYSAPVGSTLDTCLRQFMEVVHFFPVVMQRLVPWSRLFGPS